jgi:hypothetical protein
MVKCNDKGPDARETEAKSAVVLKVKIVISVRPQGSRGEARAPVSIPSRTARAGPTLPVPPVLSGRDQASPTPSIAIAPAHGCRSRESTIRIWQLRYYLFVKRCRATGRGSLIGTRRFIRSARLLSNSIEFQGRFASEGECADYLSSPVGRDGSSVPAAAVAEPGFAEPKPCPTHFARNFSGLVMLRNS